MKDLKLIALLLIAFSFSSGCKIADLQTEVVKSNASEGEKKGRALLNQAWHQHGMVMLAQLENYQVIGKDHWRGLAGSLGKMWPTNDELMRWRFIVNSFDSQLTILEGKKTGFTAGLQSWQYYEGKDSTQLEFKNKPNRKISFGLAAFHYFFELSDRLKSVPIVRFAGEQSYNGQVYDLVFATWAPITPHKEHDQYLLYISRTTNRLELASYTIRDNYLPGAKSFFGTIVFDDFRKVNGVEVPFIQSIYIGGPPRKKSKYLHRLKVEKFRFNAFEDEALRIDPNLKPQGDQKSPSN